MIIPLFFVLFLFTNLPLVVEGYTPQVSTLCGEAVANLSLALEPITCGPSMASIFRNSSSFQLCSLGNFGVDCFDYNSVTASTDVSSKLVPPFHISGPSSCGICTEHDGLSEGCFDLINAIVNAAYGVAIDFNTFNITNVNTQTLINNKASVVQSSCSSDLPSIQIFRYQSQVLCASSQNFNLPVADTNTIPGVLDMRSLTQCGTCAVLPCYPGQVCDGINPARMCPEGYYCPDGANQVKCPDNHYCPFGSSKPMKCNSLAATSCDGEGNAREVIWVPLFLSMVFILCASLYEYKQSRDKMMRETQSPKYSKFNQVELTETENQASFGVPVRIKFNNIDLKTGETVRLQQVSGEIRPGRFTAILGGSGAGKTSLMNVILGREAATGGKVFYTTHDPQATKDYSKGIPSEILDRVVAFVPQTDVYLREMTVYELIEHSARTRLPTAKSEEEIQELINNTLRQLNLEDIKNVVVGSTSGIVLSPGDRKKVNIALELVSSPNVLFLDEPTTGIDASSALNVARIIRNYAQQGLTCVAVIHQPRSEIFHLIDDMIILVRGGKMAYQGPTKYLLNYLHSNGVPYPPEACNKTDFLIDVTSKPPPKDSSKGWEDLWLENKDTFFEKFTEEITNDEQNRLSRVSQQASQRKQYSIESPRANMWAQFYFNCLRGIKQHFKDSLYLYDMYFYFIAGIVIGIVKTGGPLLVNVIPQTYKGSCPPGDELKCNSWLRFEIAPATFLITMTLGALTVVSSVRTFGREKAVFQRESMYGMNKLSYFIGKLVSDLPFLVLNAFIFLSPLVAIAPWQGHINIFYAIMVLIMFNVLGLGYMLSLLFQDPDLGILVGTILSIILNLFSGFVPKIGDGGIGYIMYTHWAARAIVANELISGQGIESNEDYNNIVPKNWKNPNIAKDSGLMILIACLLCLTSLCLLYFNNRRVARFGKE